MSAPPHPHLPPPGADGLGHLGGPASSTPARPGATSTPGTLGAPGNPGFARQGTARTVFRVAGVVLLVAGLALLVLGFSRFLLMTGEDEFSAPDPTVILANMGMFLGGGVIAGVGGAMVKAGFLGVATRYGAGEVAPVAKDTAAYLSDGEGLLGVGRTVDDAPRAAGPAVPGSFCGSCGSARGAGDRFCTGCGAPAA